VATVEEIADELYRLPPSQFIAARDRQVEQARERGDAAAARQIGGLRKPTVTAWLVNRLALERGDYVAQLMELGEALHDAQRQLDGATLRTLSARRRELLDVLLGQVRRLAADHPVGPAALSEVADTLSAALADDEVARTVRAGRLLKTVSYAGFGQDPSAVLPPTTRVDRDRVAAATAEAERTERALAEAVAAEQAASAELARVRDEMERLRTRLTTAQDQAREATKARKQAEREAAAAQHRRATAG
jgi:hypothetical protein